MNDAECSRAGCRETALWRIEWRNPKIHTPERRKVWVACDEHHVFLRDYLAARDFPVALSPLASIDIDDAAERVAGGSA